MSELVNFSGGDDFFHGGSIYSNPTEAGLLLSLDHHVDVYFPCKKARISAPVVGFFDQRKRASLDVLPDECLFEILRHIPAGQERSVCASVSKRWLMLVSNIQRDEISCERPSQIEDPETGCDGFLSRSLEGKKATDVRLASIAVGTASRGGLGKLTIKGSNSTRGVTSIGLRAIARSCPSLISLSLWNVSTVGDDGLMEIASGCHQLGKLDISHCPMITDKALIAIARGCPNLNALTVESCPNVGNQGLEAIGQFCPNLKCISIKDCPLVGDQGISSLMSSTTYTLSKVKFQGLNISDIGLAVVGHYGKSVTDLVLVGLQNVNERGFWAMGNGHGLQKLRSLTMASCRGVTDLGLEAIGKGCPNLKQFCLLNCALLSDNGVVSFAKSAISLQSLQLEECHRITHNGFFGLLLICGAKLKALALFNCFGIKDVTLGGNLPNACTSLRSLSICNCPGFGDGNLALLAKLCPQLHYVDLSGLQGITDAGFLPLVESSDAGLIKVNLSGCINVTDEVVLALTEKHGGTLELLNLDGCGKVTDAGLVSIADNCLLLNELDLSRCAITDLGVASMARSKQLNTVQVLSLSGCTNLSDKCLAFLVKLGQTLMGLNIQSCNGISSTAVDMLAARLWRCDILS